MLRSWAPTGPAMARKSPSLVVAAQPPKTGEARKLVRRSRSWVKPPLAKTTALRAATRTVAPSAVVASTPTTAPPETTSRCTRCPVRTTTPSRSAAAAIDATPTAPPSDMDSRAPSGTSTRPFGALSSGSSDQ
jgi:hypothetical protein